MEKAERENGIMEVGGEGRGRGENKKNNANENKVEERGKY